ncbi:Uncharacterised protein [Salmonella bongori]|nr:Uncharacterised protein [Salmonella bongori]
MRRKQSPPNQCREKYRRYYTVQSDIPYLSRPPAQMDCRWPPARCLPSQAIMSCGVASTARSRIRERHDDRARAILVHFANDLFSKEPGLAGNADQDIRLPRYAPHPAATRRHFRYPSAGDSRIFVPVLSGMTNRFGIRSVSRPKRSTIKTFLPGGILA